MEEFWKGQSNRREISACRWGKKGTTFQLILILVNMAEDLLCIYRTVSKALYCCSVYCIFITFKKYTTMSRACIRFYWLQQQPITHSSLYQEYFMRCNLPTGQNTICFPLMLADGGRQWPLILSSRLLEHTVPQHDRQCMKGLFN